MNQSLDVSIKDFAFMHNREARSPLLEAEKHLLDPISIKHHDQGKALLLIHGFSSSPAVYRRMIPLLSGYDHIEVPLLSGHGTNLSDFANVKYSDWITGIESQYLELSKHYQTIDVVGLSLGGLLASHLAQSYPVHHLYLLAPALALYNHENWMYWGVGLLQSFGIRTLKSKGGNLCHPEFDELTYNKLPLSTVRELLMFVRSFEVKPISCPVDIFLGQFDTVVHNQNILKKTKIWSHADVHELNRSAHILPLDYDMEIIVNCINA